MLARLRSSSSPPGCDMSHSHWMMVGALVATALATLAPPAAAVWPVNPNANLPVCTAAGRQYNPLGAAGDGAGGMLVTWGDGRSGGLDIYAQHILLAGYTDPNWPANGLGFITVGGDQENPQIVTDGAGGGILVWEDDRSGSGIAPMYAGHLRSGGTVDPAWGTSGKLVSGYNGYQNAWQTLADGSGGVIVAWEEIRGTSDYDIYAQRIVSGGTLSWGANGLLACGAAGPQYSPVLCSDLAGGAIVCWTDYRKAASYDYDIYATHVLAGGTIDSRWTANGTAVCALSGEQSNPGILSDGAGGAFIAWLDQRSSPTQVYAQHVRVDGTMDPAWPANGALVHGGVTAGTTPTLLPDGAAGIVVVSSDSLPVVHHVLANGTVDPSWPAGGVHLSKWSQPSVPLSDGAGGTIIVCTDYRNTSGATGDIWAYRVRSNGVLDPAWPVGGLPVSTAASNQFYPVAVSDGAGGAIAAWLDQRNFATTDYDIYAQRVRASGVLGIPQPTITAARDVPGDQGGKLLLAWSASEGDAAPNPYVSHYDLWRLVNGSSSSTRPAAVGSASPGRPPRRGDVRCEGVGDAATWWEFLASVPASQLSNYAYTVTTTADSLPGWIPWNVFVVDAQDNTTWAFYSSLADSGYSVDNLAPAAPASLIGVYAAGATHLHWAPNSEPDLAGYRIYRGTSAGFVPGPANLVAAKSDTGYADAGAAGSYYKLSAVDVHGNESGYSLLTPGATLAVAAKPPAFGLEGARPNPARGAALEIRFTLPDAEPATLELLDVGGRAVLSRGVGALGAGPHAIDLSAGTRIRPGLYFVRLTQGANARTARVAVID